MADKASARDLGARGLNSAIENFFSELMYELLDGKNESGPQKGEHNGLPAREPA
ncbi:MAG: hypothetical protein KKH28_00065 [Elusimicrobia bacterium]|nr:hypothetical protein [Elusimicrobiota bacterium]